MLSSTRPNIPILPPPPRFHPSFHPSVHPSHVLPPTLSTAGHIPRNVQQSVRAMLRKVSPRRATTVRRHHRCDNRVPPAEAHGDGAAVGADALRRKRVRVCPRGPDLEPGERFLCAFLLRACPQWLYPCPPHECVVPMGLHSSMFLTTSAAAAPSVASQGVSCPPVLPVLPVMGPRNVCLFVLSRSFVFPTPLHANPPELSYFAPPSWPPMSTSTWSCRLRMH
jgi:hypothetical protein